MQQMDNLADKSKEELITLINSMASSFAGFNKQIRQQEKTIKQQSSFIDILQQELSLAKQRH
jgi:flagellar hook-associated protein FlgK